MGMRKPYIMIALAGFNITAAQKKESVDSRWRIYYGKLDQVIFGAEHYVKLAPHRMGRMAVGMSIPMDGAQIDQDACMVEIHTYLLSHPYSL